MSTAGLNGLGRFGLHLLRAWLDRPDFPVQMIAINDSYHSLESALILLRENGKVSFSDCMLAIVQGGLQITRRDDGVSFWLRYTHGAAESAAWLGEPDWWLECSGGYTSASKASQFVVGNTHRVLLSATCWDADQTLIFGFNEQSFNPNAQVISYGSCTVNAFIPLANYVQQRYGVQEAAVQVLHNVPPHRLAGMSQPERRDCTLARMAPQLLSFLTLDNLSVDYVLIPYTGVSLIDFKFRLATPSSEPELLADLDAACAAQLHGLYRMAADDQGAQTWAMCCESAILLRSRASLRGNLLTLPAYFDNENSVTRYLDLLASLENQLTSRSSF